MGIESVQSRVLDRLLARDERHQDVAVELALLLRRGHAGRVEILDLSRYANGVFAGVESADPIDPALARQRGAPGLRRRVAERCDRSETGDDDSAHDCALDLPPPRSGCVPRRSLATPTWRTSELRPGVRLIPVDKASAGDVF